MKTLISLIFIFIGTLLSAQSDVKGRVISNSGDAMISATVVLMDSSDSTMVSFCLTNSKGQFVLDEIPQGEYILQVSYISYANYLEDVSVSDTSDDIDVGDIILLESTEILNEITISADHIPMGVRGDTISYNAAAFKTRPNATVEDLLRKLPGIEVERNGNIKAQGEDVENVLVDGKEFFGGDPKMATKNLAAEAVDKVDVYDKKSDIAEFTGVDDGNEEKTINLQLKEDHKNGGFGSVGIELSDNDNYNSKMNYYRFSPQMQASFVFSANDMNKETFSFNDRLEFMGGMGNMMSSGSPVFTQNAYGSRGLNESLSAGLNFNYDFSEKVEWRSHYLRNRNDNNLVQQSHASSFTDDFSYTTVDSLLSNRLLDNHQVNTKLNYKISPFTEISFKNNLFWDNNGNRRNNLINYMRDDVYEGYSNSEFSSNSDRLEYESRTMFKQKFSKKGRNFISSFFLKRSTSESLDSVMNLNRVLNNPFDILQNQEFGSKLNQLSVSANYTEPLWPKVFLGIEYQYGKNHEKPFRNYFDIIDDQEFKNDDLSSIYDKRYDYQTAGFSLRRNSKKIKNSIGLKFQSTSLKGKVNSEEFLIDSSYVHLLPSFTTEIKFKGGKTLNLDYFTSVNSPDLQQLLPFTNNLSANYQYIGNPNLVPEYEHRLGLNFHAFDNFNFSSFWAHINFSYTKNKIVDRTTIDEFFFRTIESINTDRQKNVSVFMNYSRPFKPLKLKYRIRARYRYGLYNSFVNSLATEVGESNANLRMSVSNRKTEKVFVEAGFTLDKSTRNYGVDEQFNQSYFNTNMFFDIELYLSDSWTFGSSFNHRSYSSESFSDSPSYSLWNVFISKTLLENKLEVKLSAFDLLSENLSYVRSGGNNYIQESYYNQLNSYFSLGLKYTIGKTRDNGGINMEVID